VLVFEDPVHSSDGLHEAVTAHGLSKYMVCKAGSIKSGEPHVPDENELERVPRLRSVRRETSRRSLLRIWGCHSRGSAAEPVMTTFTLPAASSS
jgi:ribosomal protein S30